MKNLINIVFFMMMFVAGQVQATGYDTDYLEIQQIGCHQYNGECWVLLGPTYDSIDTINGEDVTCSSPDVRWNSLKTTNGRAMLAMLMSTWIAKQRVSLYISGCYRADDGNLRSTFGWINLKAP